MKKLITIPFLLLAVSSFSQVVSGFYDDGKPGKKIVLHGLGTTSTYFLAPNDSTLNFDSTKVLTDVVLNSSVDSFYVYKGGVFVRAIKLGTSGGGTVTGGSIAWPGAIYNTPTTATLSGGTLTFSPVLASQAAYTVLTNATASSATPSFAKVHVRAINATGSVYDGTKYLSDDGTWKTISGGGGGAISALTAATAINTIDNLNFKQEWQWNSLIANGLRLTSTSTASDMVFVSMQKLLEVNLSGANANANQETHAVDIANTHTGTGSTNVGLNVTASGGTNNYAALFTGRVGINTAPTGEFEVSGTIVQSTNSLAFSMKDASAIRGRASTGGNIYIDANAATDNTGTINLRGNVAIQGNTTFSSGITTPNLTLGSYIRGSASTNGTIYMDVSQDFTGTFNYRATTVNLPSTVATKFSVSALNTAPASATATGTTGEIRWTATAVYLCIATNTWVKATLATF